MYAAIIESSCLRTVVFALPYHFIRNSKIHSEDPRREKQFPTESLSQGSLLGVEGLGRGTGSSEPMPRLFDRFTRRESVKHWAQWLPFLAVGIVILPLLLSSSFIIYRVVDLVLSWLEASLSKFVTIDRSCGTIALFGVYSMILMQTLLVGYFLSGLHTLYFVLGELSAGLRDEFEGCLVDLEKVPETPETSEAARWSEAFTGIRRCNEQLELKITEIRERITEKERDLPDLSSLKNMFCKVSMRSSDPHEPSQSM
eukprot:g33537.t1